LTFDPSDIRSAIKHVRATSDSWVDPGRTSDNSASVILLRMSIPGRNWVKASSFWLATMFPCHLVTRVTPPTLNPFDLIQSKLRHCIPGLFRTGT